MERQRKVAREQRLWAQATIAILRGYLDYTLARPAKIGTPNIWRSISPPAPRQRAGVKTEWSDQKIGVVPNHWRRSKWSPWCQSITKKLAWLATAAIQTAPYMVNVIGILPCIQRLTETSFMVRLNYIWMDLSEDGLILYATHMRVYHGTKIFLRT
jgi:hypothetical protein